jgi:hypothetical protein
MAENAKVIHLDFGKYDTSSLKARLGELRRYL